MVETIGFVDYPKEVKRGVAEAKIRLRVGSRCPIGDVALSRRLSRTQGKKVEEVPGRMIK